MNGRKEVSIDDKTKTPLTWIFVGLVGAAGGVLYVADIRSEGRINHVKIESLEKRQDLLENDVKTSLKEIKEKLDELRTGHRSR